MFVESALVFVESVLVVEKERWVVLWAAVRSTEVQVAVLAVVVGKLVVQDCVSECSSVVIVPVALYLDSQMAVLVIDMD